MHDMIFINLPVTDLDRSRQFFQSLGYGFDERFSDSNAASLVLGKSQVAMLLKRDFYGTFTDKPVADPASTSGCLVALSADSRDAVDELVGKAVAAGGTATRSEDHGFMYGRSFEDLDGHTWEIIWMDPAAVEAGPEEFAAQQQGA